MVRLAEGFPERRPNDGPDDDDAWCDDARRKYGAGVVRLTESCMEAWTRLSAAACGGDVWK